MQFSIRRRHRGSRRMVAGLWSAPALVVAAVVPAAAQCLCGSAGDELVAARAGLVREWVVQAPFDSAAWRLEHVVVGGRLVIAQGGDGTVAAIAAASAPGEPRPGTVVWTSRIGAAPAPVERAGIGEKSVAVARGLGLTLLDARTGATLWERPLRTVASAAAVPAAGWIYAPLDSGGLTRFPEDPLAVTAEAGRPRLEEQARAKARPERVELTTNGEVDFPPLAMGDGILWCDADGWIGLLTPAETGWKRTDFDLGGPASGPPVIHGGDIFVTTAAGDVARLSRSPRGLTATAGVMKDEDGRDVRFNGWHTVIDEIPEGGPVVNDDALVLSLGPAGIAAFSPSTGDLLWKVAAVGRPLAITGDRVWCLEETGFLVGRDLATGGRRDRLCVGCFTLPVVNTVTPRLVLASPGGLVVSLAPRWTKAAEPPVPPAAAPAAAGDPAADDPDAGPNEPAAVDEPAEEL